MTAITWDATGERGYEIGTDRGVLFSPFEMVEVAEGIFFPGGFAWNGIKGVEVAPENNKTTPLYVDGQKVYDLFTPGEFGANLKAYYYPDEFIPFDGYQEVAPGFFIDNQFRDSFGLSWRTKKGNDEDGHDLGYKIHVAWNLTAVPENVGYQTVESNIAPVELGWALTSVPESIPGYRPSAHAVIDSTKAPTDGLATLEGMLYGTEDTPPYLPTMLEVLATVSVVIIDNEDGTWTAMGPDSLVHMINSVTFEIDWHTAVMLDADTYEIS